MSDALSKVSTADLETLLELVVRERLRCPVSKIRLAGVGLGRLAALTRTLAGKDAHAVTEVLQVALSQRRALPRPMLDLVWTGPESTRSATRSTASVVREMFERAQQIVIVAGYSFDDSEILRPLHTAMAERGVRAMMFVDVNSDDIREVNDLELFVRRYFGVFLKNNWPFGPPWPDLYYDPRQVDGRQFVSLHAKCVVVDEREALLTSANFTGRGHARNIELGVRITDAGFARAVAGQWYGLVAQELVTSVSV